MEGFRAGLARGVQPATAGQRSPRPCLEPPLSNYHCQVQPASNRRQFQVHRHLDPRTSSSLPAETGNLADCKVDGCRRLALRTARAYAVHPSCRNLSRWVQRYWFQVAGRHGRAPINFEKWGGMSVQNYRNNSEWEPNLNNFTTSESSSIQIRRVSLSIWHSQHPL